MATFEAFLAHFDNVPADSRAWRSSLRWNSKQSADSRKIDIGKAVLWALVVVLHGVLFVTLDLLMQHAPVALDNPDQPDQALQLRVIRPLQLPRLEPIREPPATVQPSVVRAPVKTIAPRPDALQVQTIPGEPAEQPDAMRGQTIAPPATTSWVPPAAEPRDPFSRPPAGRLLPGAATAGSPTLRMRDPMTPQRVVAKIGALFGGGFEDPCPGYEARLVSGGSEVEREEEMARYERACPGR